MALLDVFKHKNKEQDPEIKPAVQPKAGSPRANKPAVEVSKKAIKKETKPAVKKTGKIKTDIPFRALEAPHVTEKASILAEENKYIFKVSERSNKIEIKKAVEELYHVKVESVNIIKIHRKKKRVGRKFGWKAGCKKAIVEIKKGQKIEIMPR